MQNIFDDARAVAAAMPREKTFTLVGGAFDLVHVGHVHLLEYASGLEDLLVVCVLTDASIRSYKNPTRPILDQDQRARMIASIRFVDMVYLSDASPSSIATLELLKPDSVVFGGDADNAKNVERWAERISAHSPATKIHLLPRFKDETVSTSHIIKRIQNAIL